MNKLIIGVSLLVIIGLVIAAIVLSNQSSNKLTNAASTSTVNGSSSVAGNGNSGYKTSSSSSSTTTVPAATTIVYRNALNVAWGYSNGTYIATNQTYCTSGGNRLQLDLYANSPLNSSDAKSGLRPIAIFVHGGGLTSGDKSQPGQDSAVFPTIISDLVNQGFIVASVNYLLAPSYKFPNQAEDVLCAVRFLRYYGYGIDANQSAIGIFGDSSGGQLVSIAGVTNGTAAWEDQDNLSIAGTSLAKGEYLNISSRPQAVADFYGDVNNTLPAGMTAQQAQQYDPQGYQNLVDVYNFNSTLMYDGSPIQFVNSNEPPFLIFQGDQDMQVPESQSIAFNYTLRAHGDNSALIIVHNAGHRFVPTPQGSQINPGLGYIANLTVSFFKAHLGSSSQASPLPTTTIGQQAVRNTSLSQDFIVAMPINLSQISQISKFRSCEGHDYSGYDVQGYLESNRSMKHYFAPLSQYIGSSNKVQIFAPFNGTITQMTPEQSGVGIQIWIADATSNATMFGYPTPGVWNFVFFHTNPIKNLSVGSHVGAGEPIGYENLSPPEQDFDIALQKFVGSNGSYRTELDSIFNYMSPKLLGSFGAVGVDQNNIIYSKAYRDANPCNFNAYNPNDSVTIT